jgi:hypothetical protein
MVDTLIAFIRYLFEALKRLAQVAIVVALLLLLFRVLEAQHPSVAAVTKWISEFGSRSVQEVVWFFLQPLHAIIAIAIAWPLYHKVYSYNDAVGGKVGALKVAALELIRMMETTTDGNDAKATKLNDIVYKFAVEGQSKIAAAFNALATLPPTTRIEDGSTSSSMYSYTPVPQVVIPPDLTDTGKALMNQRLADMKAFGGSATNLRAGLVVFLLLMEHGSVSGAFAHMIEYMKKQASDESKSMPNFIDLKRFFGLPTTWPEKGQPEELASKGLSWYQYLAFERALSDENRQAVFNVMKLYPQTTPDGKKPLTYSGANVLKAMRIYLYSWKIYDTGIADPAE